MAVSVTMIATRLRAHYGRPLAILGILQYHMNVVAQAFAIAITPQYHQILRYLDIDINIYFNISTKEQLIYAIFKTKLISFYFAISIPISVLVIKVIAISIVILESILLQCQYQYQLLNWLYCNTNNSSISTTFAISRHQYQYLLR